MLDQPATNTILGQMSSATAEEVIFATETDSGLQAIVILNDTTLGPALAGVRMHAYHSESEAFSDGLSLSLAMTLKAAAAGLHLGGGTVLVLADPREQKSQILLRAIGRLMGSLRNQLIAVNDVGTTSMDMRVMKEEGARVCQRDPSPFTAQGVIESMKAARLSLDSTASLEGLHVAVQGVGNVGQRVVKALVGEGAEVTIADVDARWASTVASRHDVHVVNANELLDVECDVLSPCAMGSVVTPSSIGRLKCRGIVGGANNVVESREMEAELRERSILYVPDILASSGGLIALEEELLGNDEEATHQRIRVVGDRTRVLLDKAMSRSGPTGDVARELALDRLQTRRRDVSDA